MPFDAAAAAAASTEGKTPAISDPLDTLALPIANPLSPMKRSSTQAEVWAARALNEKRRNKEHGLGYGCSDVARTVSFGWPQGHIMTHTAVAKSR